MRARYRTAPSKAQRITVMNVHTKSLNFEPEVFTVEGLCAGNIEHNIKFPLALIQYSSRGTNMKSNRSGCSTNSSNVNTSDLTVKRSQNESNFHIQLSIA